MMKELLSTIESMEVQQYSYNYINFEAALVHIINILELVCKTCLKDA